MKLRWIVVVFLLLSRMPLIAPGGETTAPLANTIKEANPVNLSPDEEVVVFETTQGDIVLRFFPDVAPRHVLNFKKLAKEGFYNGTKFHRVIPGFMIQGGDPNTKQKDVRTWGSGDPGYKINDEFNDKPHVRGTLSMAHSSAPNSAGSQFFICHARAAGLDKKYTVFGEVAVGLDVVDKIATAPTKANEFGEKSLPIDPVTINKASVVRWEQYQKRKVESKEEGKSK